MPLIYSEKNINNTKIIATFKNQPVEENILSVSFSKNIYLQKSKDIKALRLFLKLSKSSNINKAYDIKLYVNNKLVFNNYATKNLDKNLYNIWQNQETSFYTYDFLKTFADVNLENPITLKKTFFSRNKITHDDILNFIQNISNEHDKHIYNSIISGMHMYYLKNMR